MEILYLLIPIAVALAALIVWALLWAIKTGQYDDLEGPAHRILMDDDDNPKRSSVDTDVDPSGNDRHQGPY